MSDFYTARRCGGWQVGDANDSGGIEFRVFLPPDIDPRIESIAVAGTFQSKLGGSDWNFVKGVPLGKEVEPGVGTFWCAQTDAVPAGFYEYKYLVNFDDGTPRASSPIPARDTADSQIRTRQLQSGVER